MGWNEGSVRKGTNMDLITLQEAFTKSGFENLAENATFTDRLLYGLRVCAIGMLIVFAVLLILCGVLYLFKLYYKLSQKKKAQPAVQPAAPAANTGADDEELTVAMATAAIAAARNDSDAAFRIVSIRKID